MPGPHAGRGGSRSRKGELVGDQPVLAGDLCLLRGPLLQCPHFCSSLQPASSWDTCLHCPQPLLPSSLCLRAQLLAWLPALCPLRGSPASVPSALPPWPVVATAWVPSSYTHWLKPGRHTCSHSTHMSGDSRTTSSPFQPGLLCSLGPVGPTQTLFSGPSGIPHGDQEGGHPQLCAVSPTGSGSEAKPPSTSGTQNSALGARHQHPAPQLPWHHPRTLMWIHCAPRTLQKHPAPSGSCQQTQESPFQEHHILD